MMRRRWSSQLACSAGPVRRIPAALCIGIAVAMGLDAAAQPSDVPGIGTDLLNAIPGASEEPQITPPAMQAEPPAPGSSVETVIPAPDVLAPPEPLAPPAPPATTPVSSDPQDMLAELWRLAVATGLTTLGYTEWLAELVQGGTPTPAPLDQAGRTREASAAWGDRTGPVTLGQAGRVVTTFGESIPTAFCSPLTVCYIELEPGEELTDTPSWGDTVRWQVAAKVQGSGPETIVLEIKPADDASSTNIVIPTDRRLYTITLVNDPSIHTPILSFHYPDTEAQQIAEAIAARAAEEREEAQAAAAAARAAEDARQARLAARGVETSTGALEADQLNFSFRIDGRAPFRPVRVFSDGERTYIDLHPDYRGELPAIVGGPGESNAALNTRVTRGGTRLVADRVIRDIWLQAGRTRIRIRGGRD